MASKQSNLPFARILICDNTSQRTRTIEAGGRQSLPCDTMLVGVLELRFP